MDALRHLSPETHGVHPFFSFLFFFSPFFSALLFFFLVLFFPFLFPFLPLSINAWRAPVVAVPHPVVACHCCHRQQSCTAMHRPTMDLSRDLGTCSSCGSSESFVTMQGLMHRGTGRTDHISEQGGYRNLTGPNTMPCAACTSDMYRRFLNRRILARVPRSRHLLLKNTETAPASPSVYRTIAFSRRPILHNLPIVHQVHLVVPKKCRFTSNLSKHQPPTCVPTLPRRLPFYRPGFLYLKTNA